MKRALKPVELFLTVGIIATVTACGGASTNEGDEGGDPAATEEVEPTAEGGEGGEDPGPEPPRDAFGAAGQPPQPVLDVVERARPAPARPEKLCHGAGPAFGIAAFEDQRVGSFLFQFAPGVCQCKTP